MYSNEGVFSMRKMRNPMMNVIRFKESDVLCASSSYIPKTMRLTRFNDGNPTNGTIEYDGTTYLYGYYGQYQDITGTFLFNGGYKNLSVQTNNGSVTFGELTSQESRNPLEANNGPEDGWYVWSTEHNGFDKQ